MTNTDTDVRTLRPGLLVSLSTSIRGNIRYEKQEIEGPHIAESGEQRAIWVTTRVITDPDEWERAAKLRTRLRNLIAKPCAASAFGLLCPQDRSQELIDAIAEARRQAEEFNEAAALTRMSVNVLFGRIAADDVEAAKAISNELRSLMEDMAAGVERMDVKVIRDACNKARSVGQMLTPDAKGRLEVAIDTARKAARQIAKAGEQAALEVDRASIAKIEMARTSFLDLDEEPAGMTAPEQAGRALDLVI